MAASIPRALQNARGAKNRSPALHRARCPASALEVGGIWAGRLPAPPPASSWKRALRKYRRLFFSERWKESVAELPRRITGNKLLGWAVLGSPVLGALSSQQSNPPGVCPLAAGLPRGLGRPPRYSQSSQSHAGAG